MLLATITAIVIDGYPARHWDSLDSLLHQVNEILADNYFCSVMVLIWCLTKLRLTDISHGHSSLGEMTVRIYKDLVVVLPGEGKKKLQQHWKQEPSLSGRVLIQMRIQHIGCVLLTQPWEMELDWNFYHTNCIFLLLMHNEMWKRMQNILLWLDSHAVCQMLWEAYKQNNKEKKKSIWCLMNWSNFVLQFYWSPFFWWLIQFFCVDIGVIEFIFYLKHYTFYLHLYLDCSLNYNIESVWGCKSENLDCNTILNDTANLYWPFHWRLSHGKPKMDTQ